MSGATATSPRVLCRLEEIEDGQARGFTLGSGRGRVEIFVVREGRRVYGYRNSCPHVGTPLDFPEDRFMSVDGNHLLCHTHGALFEIADGLCIAGPCKGQRLTPVPVGLDRQDRIVWPAEAREPRLFR